MRIRRKKWARPELEQCSYYIENSDEMCGKWHDAEAVPFGDASRPLYLEIGCGKGIFAAQHALRYPDINIIAAVGSHKPVIHRVKALSSSGNDPVHLIQTVFYHYLLTAIVLFPFIADKNHIISKGILKCLKGIIKHGLPV